MCSDSFAVLSGVCHEAGRTFPKSGVLGKVAATELTEWL
jgi:hypothetical protein